MQSDALSRTIRAGISACCRSFPAWARPETFVLSVGVLSVPSGSLAIAVMLALTAAESLQIETLSAVRRHPEHPEELTHHRDDGLLGFHAALAFLVVVRSVEPIPP